MAHPHESQADHPRKKAWELALGDLALDGGTGFRQKLARVLAPGPSLRLGAQSHAKPARRQLATAMPESALKEPRPQRGG